MAVFGSTYQGTTTTALKNKAFGLAFVAPSSGTADSISVTLKASTTMSKNTRCAIYLKSGSLYYLIGSTEIKSIAYTTSWVEHTFNFSDPKPTITEGSTYGLVVGSATDAIYNFYWAYSSGGSDLLLYNGAIVFPDFDAVYDGTEYSNYRGYIFCTYSESAPETEYHTPSDTAKASDLPSFKPKIPLSDTAKATDLVDFFKARVHNISDTALASDELKTVVDKVLSDTAKASDVIDFIKACYRELSDTAKANDIPAFKPIIQLSDTAKATDLVDFLKARTHSIGDTALASDELKTVVDKVLSDTAKASDVIDFIKACYKSFADTAKASDNISYSFFVSIETPTENINIYR